MEKKRQSRLMQGVITLKDEFVLLSLNVANQPHGMFFNINEGILYYGIPWGNSIKTKDPKYWGFFYHNCVSCKVNQEILNLLFKYLHRL
jgi:hypothetical protein